MLLEKYILDNYSYDPDTGLITSSKKTSFSKVILNNKPYLKVTIKNTQILAHRLAWLLFHGQWPSKNIDHENGNGLDNRIKNLRDVSHSENQKNRRLSSNNKTGVTGVYYTKKGFLAQIKSDGKKYYLGKFDNLFDACCVRKSAENRFNFHPNHGSSRDL